MQRIIFYSWQSDLPNPTNRGFIQDALTAAAAAITADNSLEVEPVIDRDTLGAAGSPDIASTIFAKITAADVFVADVSITSRPEGGKPAPNPNVLLELGYAYKALGHERVILVFNRAYGDISDLPFDLRMRRVLPYDMSEDGEERAPERLRLQGHLDAAIRAALRHIPALEVSAVIPGLQAIENVHPGRVAVVRRNLSEIMNRLIAKAPRNYSQGGSVVDIEQTLNDTQEIVAEFAKIAEAASLLEDQTSTLEVYRSLSKIYENYNDPAGFTGSSSNADHDYFRFLGHEMLLILVSALIRERKWEILTQILNEPMRLSYLANTGRSGNVTWDYGWQPLPSFVDESRKRGRLSLQADLLKARHGDNGGLAAITPFQDICDADIFLYARSLVSEGHDKSKTRWYPITGVYNSTAPIFLQDAERRAIALELSKALEAGGIEPMKEKLLKLAPEYNQRFIEIWHSPFDTKIIEKIGSIGLAQIIK